MFTVVIAGAASPRRAELERTLRAQGALPVTAESRGELFLILQSCRPSLLLLEEGDRARELLLLLRERPALSPRLTALYSGDAGADGEPPRLVPLPGRKAEEPPERRIGELLFSLGMSANQKGYRYLVWALLRVQEDPSQLSLLTKSLYTDAAKHFRSTQGAVERAMRNAILNAYRRGDRALWQRYFPRRDQSKAPTNGELLAGLYEILRLDMAAEQEGRAF